MNTTVFYLYGYFYQPEDRDMDRIDEFAAAALRVVAREGLAALTFRAVAAESGWSLGAVQKAFATKRDLISATIGFAQTSISAEVSVEPGRPTLQIWLVELVMAMLPLDAERRSACLVGIAFSDRAPFDDEIATRLREWDGDIRDRLARLAARARFEGELDATVDGELLARGVLAVAAGLTGQLLYDPVDEEKVRALVTSLIRGIAPRPA